MIHSLLCMVFNPRSAEKHLYSLFVSGLWSIVCNEWSLIHDLRHSITSQDLRSTMNVMWSIIYDLRHRIFSLCQDLYDLQSVTCGLQLTICNTASLVLVRDLWSMVIDMWSIIYDLRHFISTVKICDQWSMMNGPCFTINALASFVSAWDPSAAKSYRASDFLLFEAPVGGRGTSLENHHKEYWGSTDMLSCRHQVLRMYTLPFIYAGLRSGNCTWSSR